jgi:hypothetical protein
MERVNRGVDSAANLKHRSRSWDGPDRVGTRKQVCQPIREIARATVSNSENDVAAAVLRHAEVRGVDVEGLHPVAVASGEAHQLGESEVGANTRDVLYHERTRQKFEYEGPCLKDQVVSWIVGTAVAKGRKPLTWWTGRQEDQLLTC